MSGMRAGFIPDRSCPREVCQCFLFTTAYFMRPCSSELRPKTTAPIDASVQNTTPQTPTCTWAFASLGAALGRKAVGSRLAVCGQVSGSVAGWQWAVGGVGVGGRRAARGG